MLFKFISRLLACLLCSLSFFCSPAFALQQADFSWLPNGEPNLAGYKIYYSTVSAQYDTSVDVGNPEVINGVVQAPVNGLEDSTTYYFAATAYDSDGFESDYSQEVVWASPGGEPVTPPSPPVALVTPPSPPVANDLSLSISEDITGTGQLNGQSSNSLPLSYQIVTNGSKGTALITDSGAGSFSYTPQANINGVDTFSYKVSDANGESGVAMVSITIVQVNDAPTAGEQLDFTNEDQVLKGYLTAHDVEGDSLTYTIGNNASNGLVVISADGSYSYTPDPDLNGSDFFTFQANDGSVYSNSAIVNISINPVNDVPVASDDTLNVQENQTTTGILQGNDIDSGQLIYSLVSNGILGTATIVDAATGTYTYTSAEGVSGEDSFQFIVSDGSDKSNQATVHVSIQQAAPSFALEIGELTVSGTWSYISFTETFQDPVVVAKPASSNDPSPCVVRIRNVSSKGFDIRLQNYDYITEEHGLENLGYMAVERGNFVLENGKRVEAGFFNTNATDYPEKVSFSEQFSVMPVVATSIVTEKEYDAVVSRVENISENGFDYQMQEQEANSVLHTFEEVAYIAWEPFSGMIGNFAFEIHMHQDEVNDQWQSFSFQQGFDKPPVLIAGMQSQYWRDTANLRHTELKANGVQIKVTEEQSIDSETDHAFEAFSFMAIADIDLEGDADNDGLITAEERDFYGTSPGVADTDEDGLDDGAETIFWGAAWESDADNDGIVNLLDPDSDNDGFLDGEEVELGFDPADSSSNPDSACSSTNYHVVNPQFSAIYSTNIDHVVFFNSSQSLCYEMISCKKEDRFCMDAWDFGGDGHIIGGNGDDIIAYQYTEPGDYTVSLTMTEQDSGEYATDSLIITAEAGETPLPAIGFVTAINAATVSLSITDQDPNDADIASFIVFWGDRNRSEYSGSLPTTIKHTYTRTGSNYHIRVKAVNTINKKANYTFKNDEDLMVSIP